MNRPVYIFYPRCGHRVKTHHSLQERAEELCPSCRFDVGMKRFSAVLALLILLFLGYTLAKIEGWL